MVENCGYGGEEIILVGGRKEYYVTLSNDDIKWSVDIEERERRRKRE